MTTPKPPESKTPPKPWEVVDAVNPHRILFAGGEDDARTFVETNAPRPHVDNGRAIPSVHLVSPSGSKEYHAGPESEDPWLPVEESK